MQLLRCFVTILFTTFFQECSPSSDETRLYLSLLHGYNRHVRPVLRSRDSVCVQSELSLVEVLRMDDTTGQLTVKIWLTLTWLDEYLRWNPEEHGGVTRLNFDTGAGAKIWLPDIVIFNAVRSSGGDVDRGSYDDVTGLGGVGAGVAGGGGGGGPSIQAVVRFDGRVNWVQPTFVTVTCRHEFRANAWIAAFKYGSWTYDRSMMDLRPLRKISPTERNGTTNKNDGGGGGRTGTGSSNKSRRSGSCSVNTGLLNNGGDDVVDIDTEFLAPSDHWSVLDHTGQRVMTSYDCCSEPYVSLNYILKLRKKIGPSLLGGGRK